MISRKWRRVISKILAYGAMLFATFLVLAPVLWMLATSFKTTAATTSLPMSFLPKPFTFEAYVAVWTEKDFPTYLMNSLRISVFTTLIAITLAGLAGYGFSRFRFKGHTPMMMSFLVTQMFPGVVLVVPFFMVMRSFGLINSSIALILAFTSFALPLCTWLLKGFLDSIPREIDESALVDGCTHLQVCYKIILPVAAPGIVATVLYAFVLSWNQYLFALVLTTNEKMYTLPVGIASLVGEYWVAWNELMAGATIAVIPAAIAYVFIEKYLVEGLTAGAVKG